uniref:non-specific serine/threonine protein kinase n=2 Tax=Dendroctonus ponderosae TaxID=77166 RepID=A0AAR5PAR2_DENPD
MLLCNNNKAPQDICMPSYDSVPRYAVVPSPLLLRDLEERQDHKALSQDFVATFTHAVQGLESCQPAAFQECYPSSLLQHCQKIGEGLYGEVFLYRNPTGGTTVMKVIPMGGTLPVNGEAQKQLHEVLPEVLIATKLSNLRYQRANQTHAFIEVKSVRCVRGLYPEKLLDLWNDYKETKGSENDSPEIFDERQRFMVLETSYGGCDMEAFGFADAAQSYSIFLKIVLALAIAEEELEFEHRDFHWGNILLARVPEDEKVNFTYKGHEISLESHGVKVSIIDFTMSRISLNQVAVYTNLANDCGVFNGSGDYQYEVYRQMQKKNQNEWSQFDAFSNILWLSCVLDKTITALRYSNAHSKQHKKYMSKLKVLNLEILGFHSVNDFAVNLPQTSPL